MSSSNSPCAACKFRRQKCTQECIFAPHFPPDNQRRFACVHHVFGASNVGKLLNELPISQREAAVMSLVLEAEARVHDPVYGCVGFISILQQQLGQIHTKIINVKKVLDNYVNPQTIQELLFPTQAFQVVGPQKQEQGFSRINYGFETFDSVSDCQMHGRKYHVDHHHKNPSQMQLIFSLGQQLRK